MATKEQIKQIHKDLDAAIQTVMEKHNLSGTGSSISYDATGFRLTRQFGFKDVIGENVDVKYLKNLKRYGVFYGLCETDMDKQFVLGGETYAMKGMTSKTNAVVERVCDKRLWKMPPATVYKQLQLAQQNAPAPKRTK